MFFHVEQAITRAKQNGARVVVFVRKNGEQLGGRKDNDAIAWFKANDIEAEGVPHLHAKFYMNEREAVDLHEPDKEFMVEIARTPLLFIHSPNTSSAIP